MPKFKALLLVCVFIFVSSSSKAKIIHVPSESSTIQAGINGAVNGDTVLVAPGKYYESINFYGKAILVKSEKGADSTVIDKLYGGLPIMVFNSSEDTNSVIDGFTVQNADNSTGAGGAFSCLNSSSPTIRNNIIKNNKGGSSGGGIYCSNQSSPNIRSNIIENNLATNGGGIACYNNCSPVMENNHITGNTATNQGGGIYCSYSSARMEDNSIIGNSASSEGGGIYCWYGSPIITRNRLIGNSSSGGGAIMTGWSSSLISYNLFIENQASGIAGAIWSYGATSPTITNNTVDRNTNALGAICCDVGSSPIIKNNIITNQVTGYGVYGRNSSYPFITYSDVWNNASGNFYGVIPGAGCISANPVFCDTTSDNYYLSGVSPCVGAGEGGTDIGAFNAGCGEQPRAVELIPGADKGGRAQSNVIVEFYVKNTGFLSDTYDLNITDSLGWTIVPTNYVVSLDSNQADTVTFTVSIPAVPIGTTDKLKLTAVSRADSSTKDSAYLFVSCNAIIEGVKVTAGTNQSGYADSIVSVTFTVQNAGVVRDSYSVDISDTKGWNIVPPHYNLTLDTAQSVPVSFTVTIPYVPLGTVDQLTLLAVSKTNHLARDSSTLSVTCNAYKEGLDVSPSSNSSGEANNHVTAKFYVQNIGIVTDSCRLTISDSLGWTIQPPNYKITLNPGQRDSILFDVFIPSVPVGTTDKITLKGISLTNPFINDSTFLFTTCSSYNVTLTKISDVGNDQGKQVRIDWSSYPGSDPLVKGFTLFRKIDSLLFASSGLNLKTGQLLDYPPGRWEIIGTYPAFGETLYSATVPTLKDSTKSEGMYWSLFFIRAGTDTPTIYFDSPVDSGYSLDNLSPTPPTGLFASHKPAITRLIWKKSNTEDFDYYTLYRDTSSQFQPSPNNRLAFSIDSVFIDSTAQLGEPYYYLVSATDFSGNESSHSNEAMGIRYTVGDANTDGKVSVSDIIYLINYLFRSGLSPRPVEAGNVNCENQVNITDVVYLINYLFKGGKPPCEP